MRTDPAQLEDSDTPKCPVLPLDQVLTTEKPLGAPYPSPELPATIHSPICVVGMNHLTAPMEVRAKVGITADELPGFLKVCQDLGVAECVVISTCNRTEVYFSG